MTKRFHLTALQRRYMFGDRSARDDGPELMTRYEAEREEALECIDWVTGREAEWNVRNVEFVA